VEEPVQTQSRQEAQQGVDGVHEALLLMIERDEMMIVVVVRSRITIERDA
jgi:hypothetical protein